MCVYNITAPIYLKKDTYFYKIVRGSKQKDFFTSLTIPQHRYMQFQDINFLEFNTGTLFSYKIGEEITSDFGTTPGMYCYITEKTAKSKYLYSAITPVKILKVLVKKDTRVKYAHSISTIKIPNVVLVETLTPIEVVRV